MPRKPTDPRKHYQAGRTHRRVSITLSPEASNGLDEIRRHTGLITLSGALAYAVQFTEATLKSRAGKNSEKNS